MVRIFSLFLYGKNVDHVKSKPLKTTDYTMESDILKKKKKKGDILYVFESFIMSIVIFTKILSWYVFISKRVILFESENFFNKS